MNAIAAGRIGYRPILDKRRQLIGYRLASRSIDHDGLYLALAEHLVGTTSAAAASADAGEARAGSAAQAPGALFWLPASTELLRTLPAVEVTQSPVVWLLPSSAVSDEDAMTAATRARRLGHRLGVYGTVSQLPDPALLEPFSFVHVGADDASVHVPNASLALWRRGGQMVIGHGRLHGDFDGVEGFGWREAATQVKRSSSSGGDERAKSTYGTVLKTLKLVKAEADQRRIEDELRSDPVLSFKFLRYANSPAFGVGGNIDQIGQAVNRVGYHLFGRWLALSLVTSQVDRGDMAALAVTAVARAVMMEKLALVLGRRDVTEHAFLTGLFSLLPTIAGVTLAEIDSVIKLSPMTRAALIEGQGELAGLLDAVCRAEMVEPGEAIAQVRVGGVGAGVDASAGSAFVAPNGGAAMATAAVSGGTATAVASAVRTAPAAESTASIGPVEDALIRALQQVITIL